MLKATAGTWLNYATTVAFQILFSAEFGASPPAVAFQFAFSLFVAISATTVPAMQSVLVPRFDGEFGIPVGVLRGALGLLATVGAVALGVFILAAPLAHELRSALPVSSTDAATLLRIAAGIAFLQVLVGALSAVAIARGYRFAPTVAPALPTLCASALILGVTSPTAPAVLSAVLVGSVLEVLMLGVVCRPVAVDRDAASRPIGRLLAVSAAQFGLLSAIGPLELWIASNDSADASAHYAYAVRGLLVLQQLLLGGVVLSLLGNWSQGARSKPKDEMQRGVVKALSMSILLVAAVCVGGLLVGHTVIQLAFQRGAFLPSDTRAVYLIVLVALTGFALDAVSSIGSQALAANHRNDLSVITGIVRAILRCALIIALAAPFGVLGVAAAWSVSSVVCFGLNMVFMRRTVLSGANWRPVRHAALVAGTAVGVAGICALLFDQGHTAVGFAVLGSMGTIAAGTATVFLLRRTGGSVSGWLQ